MTITFPTTTSIIRRTSVLFVGFSIACSSFSAIAGTETHGGQTVSHEGEQWLRDLIDASTCNWKKGDVFSSELAGYPEMQAKLTGANFYFANLLKNQASKLRVCLTDQNLMPVPNQDADIFAPYEVNGQQIAVRATLPGDPMDTVFIDTKLLGQMPVEMRPALWLHEQLHGLLSDTSSLRLVRLRSLVKYIYGFRNVPSLDSEELKFQLDSAQVDMSGLNPALLNATRADDVDLVTLLVGSGADANRSGAFLWALRSGNGPLGSFLASQVKLDSPNLADPEVLKALYRPCQDDNQLDKVFLNSADLRLHLIPHNLAMAAILTSACLPMGRDSQSRTTMVEASKARLQNLFPQMGNLIISTLKIIDQANEPQRGAVEVLALLGRPEAANIVANEMILGGDEAKRIISISTILSRDPTQSTGIQQSYLQLQQSAGRNL